MKVICGNCSEIFPAATVSEGTPVMCPVCGSPNLPRHGMVSYGASDSDSYMNNKPVPNPGSDVPVPGSVPGAPQSDIHEEKTMFLGAGAPGADIHDEQTILSDAPTMPAARPPIPPADDDYVPFSGDTLPATGAPSPSGTSPTLPATQISRSSPTVPTGQVAGADPTMAMPGAEVGATMPLSQKPTKTVPMAGAATGAPLSQRPTGTVPMEEMGGGRTKPIPESQAATLEGPPQPRPGETTKGGSEPPLQLEGKTLGGYRIKKKLGAGGMGAVYLAEQINLDRDVAIKVLPAKYAKDPAFIARFTREALSAAQLNHHNIMQVIDIGNDSDIHFISMEFVKGRDLGDMVRKDGKLQPEDAASYILQAARGLLYAHRHGVIHRDIKPDNMMLNENGIVKVADMGLAKMRGQKESSIGLVVPGTSEALRQQAWGELTGSDMAMGTPAYMAPEQGRDASTVDHRADQYSLGCTLYYMIAGKTPYTGKTSFEIISKHQSEPLIPLEAIVKNVPQQLSVIIQKMLSKNPEERYSSLEGVIDALEDYLGISTATGPYTPREHHVSILEKELKAFMDLPARKLGKLITPAFVAGVVAAAILGPIALSAVNVSGGGFFFAACLGLLVLTPIFSFLLNGFLTKDYFYRRVKAAVLGTSLKGWGIVSLVGLGTFLALYFTGLLVPWIVVSFFAVGLAFAWQFLHKKPLRAKLAPHLDATNQMLKELRIRGVAEESIQDFVCRFSGERWEEFFEALFGYEDMITQRARSISLDKVKPRKRHATWRDPIARWLHDLEDTRRKAREQRQLAKAEKQRLKAEGISEKDAEKQAAAIASQAVNEGLLQATAIIAAPSRADIRKSQMEREKLAMDLHKSNKRLLPGPNGIYRIVRGAVGLVIIAGAAIPLAGAWDALPGALQGLMNLYYSLSRATTNGQSLAFSSTIFALVPGVALLISSFSQRFLIPTLITLSGALVVASAQISAMSPSPIVTPQSATLAAAGLAAVFLFLLLFTRDRRRRF